MLQSMDPERLSNKEGSRDDAPFSVERGSRIDIAGGLRAVEDGNRRDGGERRETECTERTGIQRPFGVTQSSESSLEPIRAV